MSRPKDSRFPYMPGIDAMRALAVLAVFGYHAGLGWLPGGFLGVDVFFVLSGYLITSLLVAERRRDGRLRRRAFWGRRARRLLPELFAVLAVTSAAAMLIGRGSRIGLRGSILAALGFYGHWWQIHLQSDYKQRPHWEQRSLRPERPTVGGRRSAVGGRRSASRVAPLRRSRQPGRIRRARARARARCTRGALRAAARLARP